MTQTQGLNNAPSWITLGVIILALVGMTGYSLVYRMDHTSLTQHREQSSAPSREDMMGMVGQLMQRLEENPQDETTLRTLGQAFMRMQAWEQSERFWTRLLNLHPEDVQARQQLAQTLFRQERYQAAAEELKQVLAREPDNAYAMFNVGVLLTHYLDQKDAGRAYFQHILDSPSAGPELKEQAREQIETSNGG